MRNFLLPVTVGLIHLTLLSATAYAQAPQASPGRVAATVVVTDRIPAGTRFVVQRAPASDRRDFLLIRPDATPAELSAAVSTLLTARQAEGDIPTTKRIVRIRPGRGQGKSNPSYPWVSRVLADVKQASPADIPEFGRVRAIRIWLPSQSRGNRSPRPEH